MIKCKLDSPPSLHETRLSVVQDNVAGVVVAAVATALLMIELVLMIEPVPVSMGRSVPAFPATELTVHLLGV